MRRLQPTEAAFIFAVHSSHKMHYGGAQPKGLFLSHNSADTHTHVRDNADTRGPVFTFIPRLRCRQDNETSAETFPR